MMGKVCCDPKGHEFYSLDGGDLLKYFQTESNIYRTNNTGTNLLKWDCSSCWPRTS